MSSEFRSIEIWDRIPNPKSQISSYLSRVSPILVGRYILEHWTSCFDVHWLLTAKCSPDNASVFVWRKRNAIVSISARCRSAVPWLAVGQPERSMERSVGPHRRERWRVDNSWWKRNCSGKRLKRSAKKNMDCDNSMSPLVDRDFSESFTSRSIPCKR